MMCLTQDTYVQQRSLTLPKHSSKVQSSRYPKLSTVMKPTEIGGVRGVGRGGEPPLDQHIPGTHLPSREHVKVHLQIVAIVTIVCA